MSNVKWYGHSGDLGDIIFSLPTIKASGGGVLYLFNTSGKTTHAMTKERAAVISPLLLSQTYIKDVIYEENSKHDSNLNGFRDHCRSDRNLVDAHLATHGLGVEHGHYAWLKVRQTSATSVIFARTTRYRNASFPWGQIYDTYKSKAGFLGTKDEYEDFCREVGWVEHIPTQNLLEVAEVIAASGLFVGNQSVCHAIAEGLKHTIILENCFSNNNCLFYRMGVMHGNNQTCLELPKI